ncbi:hypothetical protein CHUAL_009272 [Chamberlinius hualienensis]
MGKHFNKRGREKEEEKVVKIAKVLSARDMAQMDDDVCPTRYASKVSSTQPRPHISWDRRESSGTLCQNEASSEVSIASNNLNASNSRSGSFHQYQRKPESIVGTLRSKEKPKRSQINKDVTERSSRESKPSVHQDFSNPDADDLYIYSGVDNDMQLQLNCDEIGNNSNDRPSTNGEAMQQTLKHAANSVIDPRLKRRTSVQSSSTELPTLKYVSSSSKQPSLNPSSKEEQKPNKESQHASDFGNRTNYSNLSIKSGSATSGSATSSESATVPECRRLANSTDKNYAVSLILRRKSEIEELKAEIENFKSQESQLKHNKSKSYDLMGVQESRKIAEKKIEAKNRSIHSLEERLAEYEKQKAISDAAEAANAAKTQKSFHPLNSVKPESKPAATSQLPPKNQVQYRYIDNGNQWCKHCGDVFPLLPDFLKHLHRDHSNVVDNSSSSTKPWTMKPTDKSDLTKLPVLFLKGVEFMLPAPNAFYCNLCKDFFGDSTSSQLHLESESHNINYKKFTQVNGDDDKKIESEKAASLANKVEENDRLIRESMMHAFQHSNSLQVSSSEVSAQNSASDVIGDPRLRRKISNTGTTATQIKGILKTSQKTDSCDTFTLNIRGNPEKLSDKAGQSSNLDPPVNIKPVSKDSRQETVAQSIPSKSLATQPLIEEGKRASDAVPQSYDPILPIRIKDEPKDKGYGKYETMAEPSLNESVITQPRCLAVDGERTANIEPQTEQPILPEMRIKDESKYKGQEENTEV